MLAMILMTLVVAGDDLSPLDGAWRAVSLEANGVKCGDFSTTTGDLRHLDLGSPFRNGPKGRRPTSYTPVFVRKAMRDGLWSLPSRHRSLGYEVLGHSGAR